MTLHLHFPARTRATENVRAGRVGQRKPSLKLIPGIIETQCRYCEAAILPDARETAATRNLCCNCRALRVELIAAQARRKVA